MLDIDDESHIACNRQTPECALLSVTYQPLHTESPEARKWETAAMWFCVSTDYGIHQSKVDFNHRLEVFEVVRERKAELDVRSQL